MLEIPSGIEWVESVKIDGRTGIVELTVLVNNEVVENTLVTLKCLIVKQTFSATEGQPV